MTRDCATQGHILVTGDPECLACGEVACVGEQIIVVKQPYDLDVVDVHLSVADVSEWGPAATAPD